MRNVVYAINMSIDGYCDHTHFGPDEELMEYFTNLIKQADIDIYGRKTYELMVPFWPDFAKAKTGSKVDIDFAEALTAIEKVVFTKTLARVEANSRIVRGDLEGEIRRLKQRPGKDISVGGVNLASQLMQLGLIDEFYFVVHPVIAGKGTRLFEGANLAEKFNLKLVESKVFKSGAIGLHYAKK